MIRLKKFNESKADEIVEYILSVFADLQDRFNLGEKDRYEILNIGGVTTLEIFINLNTPNSKDLDGYIKYLKEYLEIVEEANHCIEKVKYEYEDLEYYFVTGSTEYNQVSIEVSYTYMPYFAICYDISNK